MLQGQARPRPPKNKSQANPGVHPLSAMTHRTQRFEPLPPPLGEPPYHFDLETVVPGIGKQAAKLGKLVFHCVGDTGGIKSPEYQTEVATAMKGDLNLPLAQRPQFFYHLGDVVYYNGEVDKYYDQFYEPYDHYGAPILAIPGNHDGDPVDDSQTSLDGWVRYFMSPTPVVQPESQDAPRVTLSLPNVYYTLNCPFVTIIGMYTNVPEGGSIDSVQQQWLTNEFATAPTDKALIVALHHPIYSFDDHHSGSARMADAVQHAINDTRRVPNMILTAHVHNYQRIERTLVDSSPTPFIVAGHGGYYHLHVILAEDQSGNLPVTDPSTEATLIFEEHQHHGYMTLTVDEKHISGTMHSMANTTGKFKTPGVVDTFSYPAGNITLKDNQVVSL
jgi:hypothetical protein